MVYKTERLHTVGSIYLLIAKVSEVTEEVVTGEVEEEPPSVTSKFFFNIIILYKIVQFLVLC